MSRSRNPVETRKAWKRAHKPAKERKRLLGPSSWAGWMPNGLGQVKPNHYLDMLKVAWKNKRHGKYAFKVLRDGVCDGCALGTTGMYDFTMKGVHLCTVRLNLLELNTMDALDPKVLADVAHLKTLKSHELRALGRLPYPMVRHHGDQGFRRIDWDEAMRIAARHIQDTTPERLAFYITSRGLTNESYYIAQKTARFLGTNNVDNSSRICHSPSTTAMKRTIGVGASTVSYQDWFDADLVVFFGSDVPNNQPVTTKYLHMAKQQGTKVAVVNPYKEPGMERYWVPSTFESAVFGTRLADRFFQVHTGGDIAFIAGALKVLIERDTVDHGFIKEHTNGWKEFEESIKAQAFEHLERLSGASKSEMEAFADLLTDNPKTVFVWSMGLTQHTFGVQNVAAVCDLALAIGAIGQPGAGLMPIRGHSGVQGGAEMGCVPDFVGLGSPIDDETARKRIEEIWGFSIPTSQGLPATDYITACGRGEIDVLWSVGGNFLETLPDPEAVERALKQPKLRVHQDIVTSSAMLVDPPEGGTVLLLPSATRYEQPGGGTSTSTERRVYYNPHIPGHEVGEAKSEWEIFQLLQKAVDPEKAKHSMLQDAQAIRDEIARVVPTYGGIQDLKKKGDSIQWGGRRLCEGGRFPTPDQKATFVPLTPPEATTDPRLFRVTTRRGKQFNSMVQAEIDPLNGAPRDAVLMAPEDLERLGIENGKRIRLVSPHGSLDCRIQSAPILPGNLQVHWPEGNVLLDPDRLDPEAKIPDYNALVRIEREGHTLGAERNHESEEVGATAASSLAG
ncbi:MAG: FdhF/YdeP family oxidoreductase [Euryarchaeota archaeon]|nr:FdhF/YdeP family oxidoreductase [Euryarchaeota archaeon]